MIKFNCPHCHQSQAVPDNLAGRSGYCEHCNSPIYVPGRKVEMVERKARAARTSLLVVGVVALALVVGIVVPILPKQETPSVPSPVTTDRPTALDAASVPVKNDAMPADPDIETKPQYSLKMVEISPDLEPLMGRFYDTFAREERWGAGWDEHADQVHQELVRAITDWEEQTCTARGGPVPPKIMENILQLYSRDYRARGDAAASLYGESGVPAIPFLIQTMRDWPKERDMIEALRESLPLGTSIILSKEEYSSILRQRVPGRAACSSLTRIGGPAVDSLVRALKYEWPSVRYGAAIALGDIGDNRAVEPLCETLFDKESKVANEAAVALGKLKDVRSGPSLIRALEKVQWEDPFGTNEEDYRRRYNGYGNALHALARLGEPAVDHLVEALRSHGDSAVRAGAAMALGTMWDSGKPAAKALLRKLSRDWEAMSEEHKALWKAWAESHTFLNAQGETQSLSGYPAFMQVLSFLYNNKELMQRADLRSFYPGSETAFSEDPALFTVTFTTRLAQDAASIQRSPPDIVVDALEEGLRGDSDPFVRECCAVALGKTGSVRSIEPLESALRADGDASVREYSAAALGMIGTDRSVEALDSVLRKDGDLDVRKSCAKALERIGDQISVARLIAALEDTTVQKEVRRRLSEVGDPAFPQLIAALVHNAPQVRDGARQALLRQSSHERVVGSLIAALDAEDPQIRMEAAGILGEIKLPSRLSERDLQRERSGMVKFSRTRVATEAVGPLVRGLDANRGEVRDSFLKALASIAERSPGLLGSSLDAALRAEGIDAKGTNATREALVAMGRLDAESEHLVSFWQNWLSHNQASLEETLD